MCKRSGKRKGVPFFHLVTLIVLSLAQSIGSEARLGSTVGHKQEVIYRIQFQQHMLRRVGVKET